jgi:hypothetical protein
VSTLAKYSAIHEKIVLRLSSPKLMKDDLVDFEARIEDSKAAFRSHLGPVERRFNELSLVSLESYQRGIAHNCCVLGQSFF